jgi:hypothetical protein
MYSEIEFILKDLSPELQAKALAALRKKYGTKNILNATYQAAATRLSCTQLKEELLREQLRQLGLRAKKEKAALDAAGRVAI